MYALRIAGIDDVAVVMARTRALNVEEGIAIDDATLLLALCRLLRDASLGHVFLIERDGVAIGHAVVTFGFDLEFGGRDGFLTELWVDPDDRGQGAGTAALRLLDAELRARDVRALHLAVRPDNRARHLYERAGFTVPPRILMTRRIQPVE